MFKVAPIAGFNFPYSVEYLVTNSSRDSRSSIGSDSATHKREIANIPKAQKRRRGK